MGGLIVKVLIAGGAGYIGSTIASYCLDTGIEPIIIDDLSTGRKEFVRGRSFYEGDIADGGIVGEIFADHPDITCAIHCAARVVVPESSSDPLGYYRANVSKTVEFVHHLLGHGCRRIVFSSSAAIYGPAMPGPVSEDAPIRPGNPYARTKVICEEVLSDAAATVNLRVLALRYFNPLGADPRLRTGPQRRDPSHALGRMITAMEQRIPFVVTGTDFPTRDGSGLRDYLHVWDLARAHIAAVRHLDASAGAGGDFCAVNVGRGIGTTVLELLDVFNSVVDPPIAQVAGSRRAGDHAGAYARCDRAKMLLGWEAHMSLMQAVRDAIGWARQRDNILAA